MLNVKGFVSVAAYTSNVPGQTARIGELSPISITFSKEKGLYTDLINSPGYRLTTFLCKDTSSNQTIELVGSKVSLVLNIAKAIISYGTTSPRPISPSDFTSDVGIQFHGQINNFQLGPIIETSPVWCPAWFSFEDAATGDLYKLWLADTEFQNEYDEYEIVVVPPIPNLATFFGNYNIAVSQVNAVTPEQLSTRVMEARGEYPDTVTRAMSFNYVNPTDSDVFNRTVWTVIIYGRAGDNIDAIKDALQEHILANSIEDEQDWKIRFPAIFTKIEFYLMPLWHKIAIEDLTPLASIYASITRVSEAKTYVANALNVPAAAFEIKGQLFPHDYKCLTVAVLPGDSNPLNKTYLNEEFPDYIPVNTTSLDFARMSIRTQEWVAKLQQALMTAETATGFSSIPTEFRRVTRNGKYYLSMVYDNVNYLVAFRSNVY